MFSMIFVNLSSVSDGLFITEIYDGSLYERNRTLRLMFPYKINCKRGTNKRVVTTKRGVC